jgi:hypothetical protein
MPRILALFAAPLLVIHAVSAAPLPSSPLDPWVPWVEAGMAGWQCAKTTNDGGPVCSWPGTLDVFTEPAGGRFRLDVLMDERGAVELPGGGNPWPQRVQINGAPVVVALADDGAATVVLDAGAHAVTGEFVWNEPPDHLRVPKEAGLVRLTRDGTEVPTARVDNQGRLWLREGAADTEVTEADSVRATVVRRIRDGVPIRVSTQVELVVTGRPREIVFPGILIENSRAVSVSSPLPVQLSQAGEARFFVRPGSFRALIEAVRTSPASSLTVPSHGGDSLASDEVWVWVPDEAVRAVELSGLVPVDPSAAPLPDAWRGHSTFMGRSGDVLTLAESRRGLPEPNASRLDVVRELWLDLDGQGYTVRDTLSGALERDIRLEFGEGELGRMTDRVDNEDLLITLGPTGLPGAELRRQSVSVTGEGRVSDAKTSMAAVGWKVDAQSLSATLHLPPGWELLSASGPDFVGGTWLGSWTLFHVFLVLLLGAAIGKLFGFAFGLLAAASLILAHGSQNAPYSIWFHLAAVLALLRVLPASSRLRRAALVYHFGALAALVAILFPFARSELRSVFYPQAHDEVSWLSLSSSTEPVAVFNESDLDSNADYGLAEQSESNVNKRVSKLRQSKSRRVDENNARLQLQKIDPNAIVQTGPGLPEWSWRSWQLQWTGGVGADERVDLWLMPPWGSALLAILRVLTALGLALLLAAPKRFSRRSSGGDFDVTQAMRRAPWLALVVVCATSAAPKVASGTEGSAGAMVVDGEVWRELVADLKNRLMAARICKGPCAVAVSSNMQVNKTGFDWSFEIHAQQAAVWAVPGPLEPWRVTSVELGELPTSALRRSAAGFLEVRLPAGVHQLRVRGKTPSGEAVTLQFTETSRPRTVRVNAPGFAVDGVGDGGAPDASLQLTQKNTAPGTEPAAAVTEGENMPWYTVERTLLLGLPWLVKTTVRRESAERSEIIRIPLLAGEAMTTDGVRVEDGVAVVSLPRDATVVELDSELAVATSIVLEAPMATPWSEVWQVQCSQIWSCAFEGLPPVARVDEEGLIGPTWRPWPGEKLTIAVSRPPGAPGRAYTISRAHYSVSPTHRMLEATLSLTVRASQGARHRIGLPEGAEVSRVEIDGAQRNIRPVGTSLDLPLSPGAQEVKVQWSQPWSLRVWNALPAVDLGGEAANFRATLNVPRSGFVFAVDGPAWGPAVLLWSHLLSLLIVALVLSRLKAAPLKLHQWCLLSLGFAAVPAVALLPVAAWFILLAWRRAQPLQSWAGFNGLQLVLAGGTVVVLAVLYTTVGINLLAPVDTQISGAQSSDHVLSWYVDRVDGVTPSAGAFLLPELVWRSLMLLWALWVTAKLVGWLRWAWQSFSAGGMLWRPLERRVVPPSE